jgi:hypothetical protein
MKTLLIFAMTFAALAQDSASKPNEKKPEQTAVSAKAPTALTAEQKLELMTLLNKTNEARAAIADLKERVGAEEKKLQDQIAEANKALGEKIQVLSKDWPGWMLSRDLTWQPPQQAKAPPPKTK